MATVGQVGQLVTAELRERIDKLEAVVEDGGTDLAEVARIADELGELVHTIGPTYREVERMLSPALRGDFSPEHQDRQREEGSSAVNRLTKDELLERAREANVQGRSSMSKEELAQAVEAEESLSKDELLERARQADLPGRASMTKEELRTALHDPRA